MSETNTKYSKEQIKQYGETHNLFPLNIEAMIANMMRIEGSLGIAHDRIDELQTVIGNLEKLYNNLGSTNDLI